MNKKVYIIVGFFPEEFMVDVFGVYDTYKEACDKASFYINRDMNLLQGFDHKSSLVIKHDAIPNDRKYIEIVDLRTSEQVVCYSIFTRTINAGKK